MATPLVEVIITGDRQFAAKLSRVPTSIYSNVKREVTSQTLQLERLVKEKLSGEVLNVRTGRLRRSIFELVEATPEVVIGKVSSSADVPYGRIHEYGGTIKHPGGTAYWMDSSGNIRFVSNYTASRVATGEFPRTKPHTITMPERSFMRSSLRERGPLILAGLNKAVAEGTKA